MAVPEAEVTVAGDAITVASYIAASTAMGCGHDVTLRPFPEGARKDACIHYTLTGSQIPLYPDMGS